MVCVGKGFHKPRLHLRRVVMRHQKFFWVVGLSIFLCGCAAVHGETRADKRDYVLSMRQATLEQLYELQPQAEYEVDNAKGFAVFSNINSHIFLLSTGSGYGVVTDRTTGEENGHEAVG